MHGQCGCGRDKMVRVHSGVDLALVETAAWAGQVTRSLQVGVRLGGLRASRVFTVPTPQ